MMKNDDEIYACIIQCIISYIHAIAICSRLMLILLPMKYQEFCQGCDRSALLMNPSTLVHAVINAV